MKTKKEIKNVALLLNNFIEKEFDKNMTGSDGKKGFEIDFTYDKKVFKITLEISK